MVARVGGVTEGHQESLGAVEMSIILVMILVSGVDKTHQNLQIANLR